MCFKSIYIKLAHYLFKQRSLGRNFHLFWLPIVTELWGIRQKGTTTAVIYDLWISSPTGSPLSYDWLTCLLCCSVWLILFVIPRAGSHHLQVISDYSPRRLYLSLLIASFCGCVRILFKKRLKKKKKKEKLSAICTSLHSCEPRLDLNQTSSSKDQTIFFLTASMYLPPIYYSQ